MKNILKEIKNKISPNREELVLDVATSVVDTLLLSKLGGQELSPLELRFVVEQINSSVFSFLAEKKIKTENYLEEINKALENYEQI